MSEDPRQEQVTTQVLLAELKLIRNELSRLVSKLDHQSENIHDIQTRLALIEQSMSTALPLAMEWSKTKLKLIGAALAVSGFLSAGISYLKGTKL